MGCAARLMLAERRSEPAPLVSLTLAVDAIFSRDLASGRRYNAANRLVLADAAQAGSPAVKACSTSHQVDAPRGRATEPV
jgi:hypothetical protein